MALITITGRSMCFVVLFILVDYIIACYQQHLTALQHIYQYGVARIYQIYRSHLALVAYARITASIHKHVDQGVTFCLEQLLQRIAIPDSQM